MTLKKQQGIALLMAIMIVALVSIVSINMLTQRQMQIYRTANIYFKDQAYQFCLSVERWGLSVLIQDYSKVDKYDGAKDVWNKKLNKFSMKQATITGVIFDLQGRFNLNNLVLNGKINRKWFENYKRLLNTLKLPLSLADTLLDWIDKDEQPVTDGAEDIYYISLDRPYRAANQPLNNVSELLLIKGYTEKTVNLLKPFVFTADESTAVNINTSSNLVLQAVLQGLSESQATSLAAVLKASPMQSIADFKKLPAIKNIALEDESISVSSNYFVINSYVLIDKIQVNLQSIINRDNNGHIIVRSRHESIDYNSTYIPSKDKTE